MATHTPLTLSPKVKRFNLTTRVYSPLPREIVGIILGRSRLISQGFIVHPDILDRKSKEEIKIGTYVKKEMQINAWDRIVEMLLSPYIKEKATSVERTRL